MKSISKIKGVIPAMITCFDENGNFDEKRQRSLTELLISKGVHGLYLTGSTGEAFLMDEEERCAVVEAVVSQNRGRVPIIVHIGDIGTRKTIRLAKHANQLNVDAISSVPPFYFNFSQDEIYQYYEDISLAVPLPLIIYNIALAGALDTSTLKRIITLPNVKGMKYTLTNHHEIMRIKKDIGDDFMIYSGCDEMALSGFAFGADGIIGSFYNVIPEIFLQLYQAVQRKDFIAMEHCQRVADDIILFVLRFPYFSAMKRMLQWMGYDCGFVRKPFSNLTHEQEQEMLHGLWMIRNRYGTQDIELLERLPQRK